MKKNSQPINTIYLTLFSFTLFIVGIFYGSIIYKNNKTLINNKYLETYFAEQKVGVTTSIWDLLANLMNEFSYFFILWFLSLTIIGIIIVIFIVFFVGFIYGFTFTHFTTLYGAKGLYIGFLYTFPKNIFLIPLLLYLSTQAMFYSTNIILSIYYNYNRKNIRYYMNKYMSVLFFIIAVLIVYTLTDAIFIESRIQKLLSLI